MKEERTAMALEGEPPRGAATAWDSRHSRPATDRPMFVQQVSRAAADQGIGLTWLAHYLIARLVKGEVTKSIVGYSFPLNDAAAAKLADDKVGAFATLEYCGVPAVEHRLGRVDDQERLADTLAEVGFPLVAKPRDGGGGYGVRRAWTHAELSEMMAALAARYRVRGW